MKTNFLIYLGAALLAVAFAAPIVGHLIAFIPSAEVHAQVSDKRMKDDMQPLRYGLKEVMALEPKEYHFHPPPSFKDGEVELGGTKAHPIGFLVRDASRFMPEAAERLQDPASGLDTMSYTSLVPVLVNAIRELKQQQDAKIATLEMKITTLEAENAKLTALAVRMEALEKSMALSRASRADVLHAVALNR